MAKQINLKKLSPEDKAALLAQLQEEEKNKKEALRKEREEYRKTVDETIPDLVSQLVYASELLGNAKRLVFADTAHLIDLKNSIYGVKDTQQSHTFTTSKGDLSLTLGYRVLDAWDDTVQAGIEKVKTYLKTLSKDENSGNLVDTIMKLLKKDAKGNLKANRVLELKQLADKVNDPGFTEGMQIIQEAYRPVRTRTFIEASIKDDKGVEHSVPLAISSIELEPSPNK